MLAVDLMHKFELGVWKALFTHLICILSASKAGDTLVSELDCCYRMVPTFGSNTIRKFASNTSEMKRIAACDFKDVLQVSPHSDFLAFEFSSRCNQCMIPVFDVLLPKLHNKPILTLLFTCAYWHALAKMCMQTDEMLALLDVVMECLGRRLHHFQWKTCAAFDTQELKWEVEHCQHCESKNQAGNSIVTPTTQGVLILKTFNLQTYKLHALGNYLNSIHKFGTTDSYSTELVSKYASGTLSYTSYMVNRESSNITPLRQDFVKLMGSSLWNRWPGLNVARHGYARLSPLGTNIEEEVTITPDAHFHIGKSQNSPENVMMFLCKHSEDPAIKVSQLLWQPCQSLLIQIKYFFPKLKCFLLFRIKEILIQENALSLYGDNLEAISGATPFSIPVEGQVYIAADHLYKHKLMCLNYTTYDVHQAQDIINPLTSHCNIMLLADHAPSDVLSSHLWHLYIYTHVLGIFHVNATYIGPGMVNYCSHRIDVLWVCWYQYVEESAGWDTATVDQVCFPPMADEHAFGFVNPDNVLQGCHMIPQFSCGLQYPDGMGISHCAKDSSDWHFYYVNQFVLLLSNELLTILMLSSFVDHDMVMQYHWGLGVGHTYAHGRGVDNETNDGDERDQAANSHNKDIHYMLPDASDSDENGKDEEHSVWDIESDGGGSDFESRELVDDDVEDYNILDYQN